MRSDLPTLHIAILTIPGTGHVNPTTDLVVEAVSRGHRVTFVAPSSFGEAAASAGARVITYDSLLTKKPDGQTTPEEFALYLPFILLAESRHILPQLIGSFGTDVPDILLFDRTAYVAGRAIQNIWGCRAVQLFPSFAYNDQFSLAAVTDQRSVLDPDDEAYRLLQAQLDTFCRESRISSISVRDFALAVTDEAIVFLSREFQPAGETFAPGYRFVGPCFRSRQAAAPALAPKEKDERFTVYASLGTAFTDRPQVYSTMVDALGRAGVPSILSLGGDASADPSLAASNVHVRQTVDQLAVLASAELFITHAGMGGVQEALSFGVPMVCLPGTTEQQAVARRIDELGLGINLGAAAPTAHELTAAIDRARTSDVIRRNLARARDELSRCGGARAALDLVDGVQHPMELRSGNL